MELGPEPRYAGFWIRFWAFVIDYLLIGAVFSAVGWWGFGNAGWSEKHWTMALVLMWIYFTLFESSPRQASPGKMALGLRVTDEEGGRLTFLRAAGRNFAKYFSFAIIFIGVLLVAFTRRKQGLHDLLARTLVVGGAPGQ